MQKSSLLCYHPHAYNGTISHSKVRLQVSACICHSFVKLCNSVRYEILTSLLACPCSSFLHATVAIESCSWDQGQGFPIPGHQSCIWEGAQSKNTCAPSFARTWRNPQLDKINKELPPPLRHPCIASELLRDIQHHSITQPINQSLNPTHD